MGAWATCLVLFSLGSEVLANEYPVFTRRVGELTGSADHPAGIRGQDSPVLFEWQGRVYFLFGDTLFLDGRYFHPNSMARTEDFDASDGVDLTYHAENRHRPALPRRPGDFSVWLGGAYELEGKMFATYVSVASPMPFVASGSGIAVMADPDGRFEYTGVHELPGGSYSRLGVEAIAKGEYVYRTGRGGPLTWDVQLSRVRAANHLDLSRYEFWTGSGWTTDPSAPRAALFSNATECGIDWNAYLGKYICVSAQIFSAGFLSSIKFHAAEAITGPWDRGTVLIDQSRAWPGEVYSTYKAKHHPRFDKEGGRILYSFATRESTYNINIFESHLDYVESEWSVESATDDFETYLRGGGRSEVAIRFRGSSYANAGSTARARLVLPLVRRNAKDREILLHLELGVPNDRGFHTSRSASLGRVDVRSRSRIARADVPLLVEKGAREIVVESESFARLLDRAYDSDAWRPFGEPNTLSLYVSRTDESNWAPPVGRYEKGNPAQLRLCHGRCPGAEPISRRRTNPLPGEPDPSGPWE